MEYNRLPTADDLNDYGEVLVSTDDNRVRPAQWNGQGFSIIGEDVSPFAEIVAWARMPESYKEGENGN